MLRKKENIKLSSYLQITKKNLNFFHIDIVFHFTFNKNFKPLELLFSDNFLLFSIAYFYIYVQEPINKTKVMLFLTF